MKLRRAVAAKVTLTHHEDNDLAYFYGVIFYSGPLDNSDCFEETCIFADAQVSATFFIYLLISKTLRGNMLMYKYSDNY